MKKLFYFWVFFFIFFLSSLTLVSDVSAAPPANFQTEQVVTDGLDGPSGFELAPDGRIFVLQRTGEIKIVKNGQVLPENFAVLPSIASGDRGLIGIAFDPGFNITNHYVYFYYTGLDKINRLVRFDASTDVGQNGPYLIYQTNSPSEELHVGGSIRFGPDGKMYFAVGDNGYPPNAQNLSNPHGKILRINPDGSIPLDNPFVGQPGALPEIWAYGMRNPWRFQFDSATGELYGGDVGDYTWEEVNHIQKGKNYGWPTFEGYCNALCGTAITPIHAYNHNGDSAAVTGGPVYRGTMFPEEYRGSLFFGDYAMGFIKYLTLNENGTSTGVHDFDLNAGSVVDLKVADDGSLYYITYWPGRLYKISYTTGNHIPTANATADDPKGVEPHTVHFSSTGSSDPDGDPLTYLWKFGDGTTSTEANPVKTYYIKGTYAVELSVSDGVNNANAVPVVVQVGIPPTVNIGEPTDGSNYHAGDTIHYTASALDGAGFDINDNNLSTEILLHHHTHIHPFLGPIIGRQGTFTIPTTGEASADTWFEIKVTATDDNGLSTTKSTLIYPIKSHFTLATVPAGLNVNLDGVPHTAPITVEGVVNFKRELNAPTVQTFNSKQYQFQSWSDGLAQKHFITTQATEQTYTATFVELPAFNAEYFNNENLSGQPALVRQDNVIDFNWTTESPAPQINADNFSARWTRTQYFASGKYKFTATVDDGVRLYVDNQLIIDEWHGGNASHNAVITLAGGQHTIKMEYMEQYAMANAKLDWELTLDQPVVPTDFQAQFFNNKNLTGQPILERTDATVDFDWGPGSPDATVPNDNFSARFTKTADLPAGNYELTVTGDDGVRLFVDNELVIDKWIDQSAKTYKATKTLTAGSHTIKFEYFENGGDAVAKMSYVKLADTPIDGFAGQYFANKTLTGAPVFTRTDPTINFDWGGGSPDATVPNDNFSTRWTKTATFEDGTYEFTVTADDGVRLKIDGETILDKWMDQSPTTYKVSKALTAGDHIIIMEYFETGGGAVAKLSYEKTGVIAPITGYTAEYFNNETLTAPVVVTKNEPEINFDWGGGSPDALINANNFSARFTRIDTFENDTYEFTITADDGIRVKVDGEVILDKWINQSPTTYKVSKALTAGNHTVVVEYYENGGGAVAQVSYAKKVIVTPIPGDFTSEFFNNKTLTGTPILTRTDTAVDFNWAGTSPAPVVLNDNFSARFTKTQTFTAGNYEFTVIADDGVRLKVDGEVIIDKWIDQSSPIYKATKQLPAGDHTIVMEYYEAGGDAVAKLNYAEVTVPPAPADTYAAEYFNNKTLTGTPTLTRNEATIDFDWALGSPDASIQTNEFSARFTKTQTFEAANYKFTTISDDGIRIYIDNELIIDQWNDQSSQTHTVEKQMTAGNHVIKVEYYEGGWTAVAKFSFEKVTTPQPPAGFVGEYFNTIDLSGPIILMREDPEVNFNWNDGSPDPLIPNDHFSARFTKQKHFATGTYTFTITADDGVRVFVDNQLIIDKWIDQPATTYSTTVSLTEGVHDIKIEYYENYGGAKLIFQIL